MAHLNSQQTHFDHDKENNSIESPISTNDENPRKSFSSDQIELTQNSDQYQQSSQFIDNNNSNQNQNIENSSISFEQISSDQYQTGEEEQQEQDQSQTTIVQPNSINVDLFQENPPEEIKSQRELDEEDIPINSNSNENSFQENLIRRDSNPVEIETVFHDDRPLTKLEQPFQDQQNDSDSSIQLDQQINSSNNQNLTEPEEDEEEEDESSSNEIDEKRVELNEEILPPLSSTSIAMELTNSNENNSNDFSFVNINDQENIQSEENHQELIIPTIQLEQPLFEEIQKKDEEEKEDEDKEEKNYPPLNSTSMAMEQINENHLNPNEIPLECSLTTTNEEIEIDQEKLNSNVNETNILPEPEDLLGNKSLIKQIIVKGKENDRPTRSTLVKISYQSFLVNQLTTENRLIEQIEEEEYFVGECDLIPAIDISIQSMNQGEKALIDSDLRHCYGDLGWKDKEIPPSSSTNQHFRIKIHLEFHQWTPAIDVQTLSIDERLRWGNKKRQMGNFYYQRQDYSNSLQSYRGALRFLDFEMNPISTSTLNNDKKTTLIENYIQIQNNIAQVNLNLNRYQASLEAIENVLRYDSTNVKALFRQGKAFFQLGKYEEALQPLRHCLQLQRSNSSTQFDQQKTNEIISICENKLANYQKNEKEIYRRMFQPSTSSTSSSTTTDEQRRNPKSNERRETNSSNQWLTYLALGSAALALLGIAVAYKYRKVS